MTVLRSLLHTLDAARKSAVFWAAVAAVATAVAAAGPVASWFREWGQPSNAPELLSCKQLGSVRSLGLMTQVHIDLFNGRNDLVKVMWIDYRGNLWEVPDEHYFDVYPHQPHSFWTHYNHIYMIADRHKQCISLFRAREVREQALEIKQNKFLLIFPVD